MIAAWMLYSAAVGALICTAAVAWDRFSRLLRLPVRWVWIAGMGVTLALSVNALVRMASNEVPSPPGTSVQAYVVESSQAAESTAMFAKVVHAIAAAAGAIGSRVNAVMGGAYAVVLERVAGTGLIVAWGAVSAALLLVLGATLLRMRRARASWRAHCIDGVDVLVARDAGPALVGLIHPAIVIPEWLLSEAVERQQLVVQHEDEHRRAGDHSMLAIACIAVCLVPWNVPLWWMLVRTRLAVELDCDARVLGRGAAARSYGSLLLDIAGRSRVHTFAAPALADSASHLERRLIAMTENRQIRRRSHAAAAALSALLLGAAACATELPTAAAIDEMDVREVELRAEEAGLIPLVREGTPLYVIDGVVVTEVAAKTVMPHEIASIEVVKGDAARRTYGEKAVTGVIRISTRANGTAPASSDKVEMPLGVPLTRSGNVVVERRAEALLKTASARQSQVRIRDEDILVTADNVTIEGVDGAAAHPLVILDGVIMQESYSLNSLAPGSIERIEILKGEAARRLFSDARALNGVIRIVTKAGGSR